MTFEKNKNARFWETGTLAEYINSSEFGCDDSDKDNIFVVLVV